MACPNQREEMLLKVQRLGFMTDDLRLFLNTHPCSQEALRALQYYLQREQAARAEYEKAWGPLTLEALACRNEYDWIDHPWPWEKEV